MITKALRGAVIAEIDYQLAQQRVGEDGHAVSALPKRKRLLG